MCNFVSVFLPFFFPPHLQFYFKINYCNFYNIYKSLSNNILTLRKIFEKKCLKIRLLKKMIVFLHSKYFTFFLIEFKAQNNEQKTI